MVLESVLTIYFYHRVVRTLEVIVIYRTRSSQSSIKREQNAPAPGTSESIITACMPTGEKSRALLIRKNQDLFGVQNGETKLSARCDVTNQQFDITLCLGPKATDLADSLHSIELAVTNCINLDNEPFQFNLCCQGFSSAMNVQLRFISRDGHHKVSQETPPALTFDYHDVSSGAKLAQTLWNAVFSRHLSRSVLMIDPMTFLTVGRRTHSLLLACWWMGLGRPPDNCRKTMSTFLLSDLCLPRGGGAIQVYLPQTARCWKGHHGGQRRGWRDEGGRGRQSRVHLLPDGGQRRELWDSAGEYRHGGIRWEGLLSGSGNAEPGGKGGEPAVRPRPAAGPDGGLPFRQRPMDITLT